MKCLGVPCVGRLALPTVELPNIPIRPETPEELAAVLGKRAKEVPEVLGSVGTDATALRELPCLVGSNHCSTKVMIDCETLVSPAR